MEQKIRQCGASGSTRGTNVTTLAPGATITVTWKETIDHPGHYRISFDADGQDFYIPMSATENTEGQLNVIDDLIPDVQGAVPVGGRMYSQQITLPNVECNNCTLQLIQMMTDKPPYATDGGVDDNDMYYQCADITLSSGAPMPDAGTGGTMPDAPPGNGNSSPATTGGCSTSGGAGLAIGLALLGLVTRRRRAA